MDFQKAVLKLGKTSKDAKETPAWKNMTVQYNPASLSFSSRAGLAEERGAGEAGLGTRKSAVFPPETTLHVELFFEEMDENQTGFVQRQVEELLSLVMQEAGRQVVFAWGDMSFGGELESVSASYTMFRGNGAPIRASASLSIRQAEADCDAGTNKTEQGYWEKAWKDFQKLSQR